MDATDAAHIALAEWLWTEPEDLSRDLAAEFVAALRSIGFDVVRAADACCANGPNGYAADWSRHMVERAKR